MDIIYVGAGLHFKPLLDFSNNNFIYVDSQPRNEYGFEYYYKPYYKNIYLNILNKLNKLNYKLENYKKLTDEYKEINVKHLDPTLLYFNKLNSDKYLKYYISTGIPNNYYNNILLQDDIKKCDTIIISGHYPDACILEYIVKPFNVICYEGTFFPKDLNHHHEDDIIPNKDLDVIDYILNNPNNIKSYIYVSSNLNKYKFNNYDDFYNCYKNSKNKLFI